ncbi:MAG: hypothetical protein MHM6MM_004280 [Cercozoa sp. M6MM]
MTVFDVREQQRQVELEQQLLHVGQALERIEAATARQQAEILTLLPQFPHQLQTDAQQELDSLIRDIRQTIEQQKAQTSGQLRRDFQQSPDQFQATVQKVTEQLADLEQRCAQALEELKRRVIDTLHRGYWAIVLQELETTLRTHIGDMTARLTDLKLRAGATPEAALQAMQHQFVEQNAAMIEGIKETRVTLEQRAKQLVAEKEATEFIRHLDLLHTEAMALMRAQHQALEQVELREPQVEAEEEEREEEEAEEEEAE